MLKGFLKLIKALTVGVVWTVIYVYGADLLMISLWNFDFLNISHWQVIDTFWENGGKIKTGRDYAFVAMLAAVIPLWLAGWRYFYRVNFMALLLFPFTWYNNRMIRKYGENSSHIILKNMGATQKKPNLEEIIESRMQMSSRKPVEKEAVIIRQNIQEKLSSAGKK